jgi:hypothetical protein
MQKPFYKKRYQNFFLHPKPGQNPPERAIGLLSNRLQGWRPLARAGQLKKKLTT